MKTPELVVVGSVNTDMVVKSRRIPGPGETVTGGRFVMVAGGKGANQAVAAARLGARVALVAKVGQDVFGEEALANFHREKIDTSLVVRDDENATGVALILVDEKGENSISVAPGANFALLPEEIDAAAPRIREADAVLLQLEVPMDTVVHTARLASEAGTTVILDPAPAASLSEGLLGHVDVLTPNETEARQLTGIDVVDEASARAAAEELCRRGARRVVVTLGPRGALVVEASRAVFVPGRPVEAVDTTAAGDAFNGGLACALARGASLDEAVRSASLVGALSVTRMGAQPSLPTSEELEHFSA